MPTSLSKWWGSFREMMIPKRQSRRLLICDAGITLGFLAVAAAVCTLLRHMGDSDSAVPMVFMLAVLLVTEARHRLRSKAIPEAFRGLPITLVYIGVLALAIYGFTGHSVIL